MSPSAPDQLRALASYAFEELADGAGGLGAIHGAIADRAFRLSGGGGRDVGARPAEAIHRAVSRGVYGALRGSTTLLGRAADAALAQRDLAARPPLGTRGP